MLIYSVASGIQEFFLSILYCNYVKNILRLRGYGDKNLRIRLRIFRKWDLRIRLRILEKLTSASTSASAEPWYLTSDTSLFKYELQNL